MEKGKQISQRIKYDTENERKLMIEIIKRLDNLINGLSQDKTQIEDQIKRVKRIREQQIEIQNRFQSTFE